MPVPQSIYIICIRWVVISINIQMGMSSSSVRCNAFYDSWYYVSACGVCVVYWISGHIDLCETTELISRESGACREVW